MGNIEQTEGEKLVDILRVSTGRFKSKSVNLQQILKPINNEKIINESIIMISDISNTSNGREVRVLNYKPKDKT